MQKGDYKDTREGAARVRRPSSTAWPRIAGHRLSGIGYRTSEVRAVPLAKTEPRQAGRAGLRQRPQRHLSAGPDALYLRGKEAGRAAARPT